MERYLNTAQVAEQLGVRRRRVQNLIETGQLGAEKFESSGHGVYLIPESAFRKWFKEVWPTIRPRGVPRSGSPRKSPRSYTPETAPLGPPLSESEREGVEEARADIAAGRVISHEEIKRRFGL